MTRRGFAGSVAKPKKKQKQETSNTANPHDALPQNGVNLESEPANYFAFMRLPKELRLMVYERLPRLITYREVRSSNKPGEREPESFTLVMKSTHTTILRVSKAIYNEAHPIIQRTIRNFLLGSTPKMMACISGSPAYAFELLAGCIAMEFMQFKQQLALKTVLITRCPSKYKVLTVPIKRPEGSDEEILLSRVARLLRETEEDCQSLIDTAARMRVELSSLGSHQHLFNHGLELNMKTILLFIAKSFRQLLYHELQQLGQPTIEYFLYYWKRGDDAPWLSMSQDRIDSLRLYLMQGGSDILQEEFTNFSYLCADSRIVRAYAGFGVKGYQNDPAKIMPSLDYQWSSQPKKKDVACLPPFTWEMWEEEWLEGKK